MLPRRKRGEPVVFAVDGGERHRAPPPLLLGAALRSPRRRRHERRLRLRVTHDAPAGLARDAADQQHRTSVGFAVHDVVRADARAARGDGPGRRRVVLLFLDPVVLVVLVVLVVGGSGWFVRFVVLDSSGAFRNDEMSLRGYVPARRRVSSHRVRLLHPSNRHRRVRRGGIPRPSIDERARAGLEVPRGERARHRLRSLGLKKPADLRRSSVRGGFSDRLSRRRPASRGTGAPPSQRPPARPSAPYPSGTP
mmetsp:Transcript_6395/g.26537  ORF Transcript_6395/g.26537 Transcript_6395/m.26537 type:complete len:251 (-) Transcript_6395:97-849(-)